MPDALIPYKECKMGFAIQAAQGAAAAAPTALYPMPEAGSGLHPLKNYTFFNWADNNYGVAHYMSEGQWNEGTITVPVIPGYTLADDANDVLYKWCFERENAAAYYDSKWATIWRSIGHKVERFEDCKCMTGTIRQGGGTFMALEMNVVGIVAPVEIGAFPAGNVITVDPYVFSHAVVSLGLGGAGAAGDAYETDLPINFDNHVTPPSDMITLRPSAYPVTLGSTQKATIGGTMNRIFINADVYADFKAGQEGIITVAATSGVTCTLTLPRVLYVEDPIGIPTEDMLKEDSVGWQALASVDGLTDAMSILEA